MRIFYSRIQGEEFAPCFISFILIFFQYHLQYQDVMLVVTEKITDKLINNIMKYTFFVPEILTINANRFD